MANDVFKCRYETNAYRPEVIQHFAAVDEATEATWAYVHAIGAIGFHSFHHDGGLAGVIFNDLVGRADFWKVQDTVYHPGAELNRGLLCVPKRTKAAAGVLDVYSKVPAIPSARDLAIKLGAPPERITDGSKLYWPTAMRVTLPTHRVFVLVPRQIDDGWEQPRHFTEVPESVFMHAIAEHNALVPKDKTDE